MTTIVYESEVLVRAAFDIARELQISTLLVQADELPDLQLVTRLRTTERIVWLTRGDGTISAGNPDDTVIRLPEATLTRLSQLKIGLLEATIGGSVGSDESVVCLSGVVGSARLDTLLIANPLHDFPWLGRHHLEEVRRLVARRHLVRLLDIALRLAGEGREGRSVGTIFVLADPSTISRYLRQLVLNPLEGHAQRTRNIHNEEFFETIREFAALDGAFVVDHRGIVASAGTYIDAPARHAQLRRGYGARHVSAQAITAATGAISIVVSASSSTVTVFHEGEMILEIERPEPARA